MAGLFDLLRRMGGAGTIASPLNSERSQPFQQYADPISQPQATGIDPTQAIAMMAQGAQGQPVQANGPLRTAHGVTMVAPALQSLTQLRQQLGLPVFANVVSDYRTRAEQAALYQQYLNGTGNLAAPPGQSNHETGHAVDISSSWLSANPQVRAWLLAHSWTNDVPGEPWHWEYGV